MAKVFFEKFHQEGEAVSPLDGSLNKWVTVGLYVENGMLVDRVKVNFWEREIKNLEALRNAKPGSLFGEGNISTVGLPNPIEVGGKMVNHITIFRKGDQTSMDVLKAKGLVATVEAVTAEGAEIV